MQSRGAAKRNLRGVDIAKELAARGIIVKAGSMSSLAEEASAAYKNVSDVVDVTEHAGISVKIIKSVPMGVVKG